MLLTGQTTDLDWNAVLWMCFDDVTFQEQFRFTKVEFLVILSNMQDQNGADLADEVALPVMMHRIGSGKRDYIRCRSDSRSWFC
jgi:hypothetical protein